MITQDASLFPSLFIQPMNVHTEMFAQTQILMMMMMVMMMTMMMMMMRPSIRSIYRGTVSFDFERVFGQSIFVRNGYVVSGLELCTLVTLLIQEVPSWDDFWKLTLKRSFSCEC